MVEQVGREDVIPAAASEVSDEVLRLNIGRHGRGKLEVLGAVSGVFARAVAEPKILSFCSEAD